MSKQRLRKKLWRIILLISFWLGFQVAHRYDIKESSSLWSHLILTMWQTFCQDLQTLSKYTSWSGFNYDIRWVLLQLWINLKCLVVPTVNVVVVFWEEQRCITSSHMNRDYLFVHLCAQEQTLLICVNCVVSCIASCLQFYMRGLVFICAKHKCIVQAVILYSFKPS